MRFRLGFAFAAALALAAACSATKPPATPVATAKPAATTASNCMPYVEPHTDAGPDEPATVARKEKRTYYDHCEVADDNLAEAESAILTEPGGNSTPWKPWDRVQKPMYWDLVAHRLLPTKAEREMLNQNAFVIRSFDTRMTYAWALHDVYQWQLPVYISADAILHAVYMSNDQLIDGIERLSFGPTLTKVLSALHCSLGDATKAYPADVAHDLDLYLTVARSLLEDHPVKSVFGTDAEAAKLVEAARGASGMSELSLFGRARLIDWSQYQPRGHYIDDRAAFFRAVMWLGRLEFNLVSRSSRSSIMGALDPTETPREALDAVALADLTERAGMLDEIAKLDRTWALLAGKREDVSLASLAAMKIDVADPNAFSKLKTNIGTGFQRTARFHPMAEGATDLPVIATFLGPRITPEAAALRLLTHSETPERHMLTTEDVAYVLGVDRAKQWIPDLAKYPELGPNLDRARDEYAHRTDAGDLYSAWLGALSAKRPEGQLPSFMKTEAYDDLRVDSVIAGYGQIRHNYVAIAAQGYDEGGCAIPNGYVEPRVGVYDQIAEYAKRGATMMREVDPNDQSRTKDYFATLETLAKVLATISRHELEGRKLTDSELHFLGMVVEMLPGSTGGIPTYTGWYFDLFRNRWKEALGDASFIADFYTSGWDQKVAYAGATAPQLGVFVIDTGGAPRLAVGPVARAFGTTGDLTKRFASLDEVKTFEEPWARSYSVGKPTAVPFALSAQFDDEKHQIELTLTAPKALPEYTIDVLDHHGAIIQSMVQPAHAAAKKWQLSTYFRRNQTPEGVRVRVGDYYVEGFSRDIGRNVLLHSGGVESPPYD